MVEQLCGLEFLRVEKPQVSPRVGNWPRKAAGEKVSLAGSCLLLEAASPCLCQDQTGMDGRGWSWARAGPSPDTGAWRCRERVGATCSPELQTRTRRKSFWHPLPSPPQISQYPPTPPRSPKHLECSPWSGGSKVAEKWGQAAAEMATSQTPHGDHCWPQGSLCGARVQGDRLQR